MSTIYPFRALRPLPSTAELVSCPPYDVLSLDEAREIAAENPNSFVRIIRPEVDFPEDTDPHTAAVYRHGAANLKTFADGPLSVRDEAPAVYVYRMIRKELSQTGVFACVHTDDYRSSRILKHENTRPDKESDRTRHIVTQRAHAEPVMLTYRDDEAVDTLVDRITRTKPLYDFVAPDGVRQTLWRENAPAALVHAFSEVDTLYVADGHHRCAAATRAAEEIGYEPAGEHTRFPAVLIPMSQIHIMAYNRVVYNVPGGNEAFRNTLEARFGLSPTERTVPHVRGKVCLYLGEGWFELTLPPNPPGRISDQLDVARLTTHILEPLLHIGDPRTDPNIEFVGGARGTGYLSSLVDTGRVALAISMYPTGIEELVAVSDARELMPPKTTWFEPKLRTGLLVHEF